MLHSAHCSWLLPPYQLTHNSLTECRTPDPHVEATATLHLFLSDSRQKRHGSSICSSHIEILHLCSSMFALSDFNPLKTASSIHPSASRKPKISVPPLVIPNLFTRNHSWIPSGEVSSFNAASTSACPASPGTTVEGFQPNELFVAQKKTP